MTRVPSPMFKQLLIVPALILASCSGSNRPTPEQCEQTYQAAILTCDTVFTKPDDLAKCHAASTAIRLACLIASEQPGKSPAKAGQSKADRWAQAYPSLVAGTMTPEAFESFVKGE